MFYFLFVQVLLTTDIHELPGCIKDLDQNYNSDKSLVFILPPHQKCLLINHAYHHLAHVECALIEKKKAKLWRTSILASIMVRYSYCESTHLGLAYGLFVNYLSLGAIA